jgi:hypothetical protein
MSDLNDEGGRASARSGASGGKRSLQPIAQEESPDVPLFRTWAGVYGFVFGCFAAAVLALTIFTWVYA